MTSTALEVRFRLSIGDIPDAHREAAQRKAEEAYVLMLLRQGDISAGRAAEVLGVDRWSLSDLMSAHGISPFDDSGGIEDLADEVSRADAAGRTES